VLSVNVSVFEYAPVRSASVAAIFCVNVTGTKRPAVVAFDGGLSCPGQVTTDASDGLVGGLGRVLAVDSRTAFDRVHSSVRLIAGAGFREYFNPFDGTGYGTDGFGWSAALTIDFIERLPRSERDQLEERLRASAAGPG